MEVENEKVYKNVLDNGFVELLDVMGDDDAIADAARVSYSKGTQLVRKNEGLIDYLMRHNHTSPFEMVEFKFHIKLPIFVARQWMRHRTGSFNEISGRYSIIEEEFYIPLMDRIVGQDQKNKQASDFNNELSHKIKEDALFSIYEATITASDIYRNMLINGVSRELARIVLPLNTYTQFIWKIDCNNLLKFITLRTGAGAQHEIKVYAEAILELIEDKIPLTLKSYRKYILKS